MFRNTCFILFSLLAMLRESGGTVTEPPGYNYLLGWESRSRGRSLLQSKPIEAGAAAPPPSPVPKFGAICYDAPWDWKDDNGKSCSDYLRKTKVELVVQDLNNKVPCVESKAASTNCCVCGGGERRCSDAPGWSDSDGIACPDYVISRCKRSTFLKNQGSTPTQTCCICGGGERPCAGDPFGSLCPQAYYWVPIVAVVFTLAPLALCVYWKYKGLFCFKRKEVSLTPFERDNPVPWNLW